MSTTPAAAAPQLSPAKVAAPIAQLLALDQIHPDPNQPRKKFDEAALKDLAESIKAEGLVQPMVVRPNGKGYYLVAGERRLKACKLAGLKEAPVIVRPDLKDQDVQVLQMVENLQREDLSLPEQCDAITKLVKTLGSARAAAEKLGKSEAWVSKRAAAHKLPVEVKKLVDSGQLVDIEVAAALGELKETEALRDKDDDDYRETSFNDLLDELRAAAKPNNDPMYDQPRLVTRDAVRAAVRAEKESQEAFRKDKEEAAKAAARAKAIGTKGSGAIASGTPEPARKVSEAERRAGRVAADRKNLKDKVYTALYEGLKLGKGDRFMDPLALQYLDSASDYEGFPRTSEACRFEFQGWGEIALLKKFASGLPGKVVVDIEPMRLSLEEAQKVSDALKGTPGFKELSLSFKHKVTGADLRSCVAKLAPDQVKTLPLPRAEREKAKAAALGKNAAKPKASIKKAAKKKR